jgi:hypothetical protein
MTAVPTVQHCTVQYSKYSTVLYTVLTCNTAQCSTVLYTAQRGTVKRLHCSTVLYTVEYYCRVRITLCKTVLSAAGQLHENSTLLHKTVLQSVEQCSTGQDCTGLTHTCLQ